MKFEYTPENFDRLLHVAKANMRYAIPFVSRPAVQGYLAYKKTRPPRTLLQAQA